MARRRPFPARCVICGEPFDALTRRYTCCSAECQRERRLRCARAWYLAHRAEHIASVLAARRRHAENS